MKFRQTLRVLVVYRVRQSWRRNLCRFVSGVARVASESRGIVKRNFARLDRRREWSSHSRCTGRSRDCVRAGSARECGIAGRKFHSSAKSSSRFRSGQCHDRARGAPETSYGKPEQAADFYKKLLDRLRDTSRRAISRGGLVDSAQRQRNRFQFRLSKSIRSRQGSNRSQKSTLSRPIISEPSAYASSAWSRFQRSR